MPTPRRTEWVKLWSRGDHPLLVVDGFLRGHRDLFGTYFGLPFRMRYYLRHSGETSFEVGELNALRRLIRKRLETSWPGAMVRKMHRDLQRWTSYARRLDPRRVERKQLEHFFYLQQLAWMSVYLPLLVGDVIEGELGKMTAGFEPARRERILRLAATPLYPTLQARYLQAVRRIAKLRGQHFDTAAERLTLRYAWVKGYLMNVRPLTVAMVRRDARALGQVRPHVPAVKLTHTPKLRRLARLGCLYCWFRDWRLSAWNETFYFMRPLFESYLHGRSLTYPELCQLSMRELLTKRFRRSDIRQRQRGYGVVMEQGRIRIVTGSALAALKRQTRPVARGLRLVQGQPAVPGQVRGRVRLAFQYHFDRIRPGDIVVTGETTPEAVPFLRRVKAIVTDEGGLTSHAAIIAREFHIPCVIGTKIATKVFHDGDRVEVDANRGVIRKISE